MEAQGAVVRTTICNAKGAGRTGITVVAPAVRTKAAAMLSFMACALGGEVAVITADLATIATGKAVEAQVVGSYNALQGLHVAPQEVVGKAIAAARVAISSTGVPSPIVRAPLVAANAISNCRIEVGKASPEVIANEVPQVRPTRTKEGPVVPSLAGILVTNGQAATEAPV